MQLEKGTSFIYPFSVTIDIAEGIMKNPKNHIVRRASDLTGYFADRKSLDALIDQGKNPVLYEVFEVPVPEEYGHIMTCISKLLPGKVGNEYYMTKGHYHSVSHTGEIYLCLKGEGFMLMKTKDGQFHAEIMKKNSMLYVPPYWAHRSVNTGDGPLISFCSYNAEAGHNYDDIEKEGFVKRVLEKNGIPVIE